MNKATQITLAIAAAALTTDACAIDKETTALLTKLSKQVAELQSKATASDTRIQELEKNLEDEKLKNRKPNVVAGAENTSASSAPISSASTPGAKTAEPMTEARPPVTLGDVKGTFKIPGADTSIGMGGYVKLDINESSAGTGVMGDSNIDYTKIPVGARALGSDSQLAFSARETRLWLKSFTPSKWGDINTYVEFDLYGSSYAYAPNLRHAYGSFGNLLAGQTWSTFVNDASLPDTLDNTGPVGTPKVRQPLLRWTQPFKLAGESFEFMSSVEAPRSTIANIAAPSTITSPGANRYPDVVGRLNYKSDWGNLSLAGMARDIRYAAPPLTVSTRNELGGAVSLAGKINIFSLDNIRFVLNYGNALGSYLTNTPFEDAIFDPNRDLKLVNSYSGMLAYQHWWTEKWRSNMAYGFEQADRPISLPQTTLLTQQVQSFHANLLWNPLPQATLGVEYIYGSRTLVDGGSGNLSRAQLSAKYSF